jgi:putative membrane-bound dehydrogenase-like protein
MGIRSKFVVAIWSGMASLFVIAFPPGLFAGSEAVRDVGVAAIDVTPNFPIRLMGYYGRNTEATNAVEHIFARALAIGSAQEGPAVVIALDNCIIPPQMRDELARRLREKSGLAPERFALCATHTHSAPCLAGAAPNLFGADIPPADQAHIDRYTREVLDKLEKVALAALKDRRPAILGWDKARAGFAANRRTKGGPVDDELPFLTVTDLHGRLRAIWGNYACHCTTLGGDFREICGDWAGYAAEYLQESHPGAIALITIGCGGDANPSPRGTLDLARKHGREFTDAVNHSLERTPFPLRARLECRAKSIQLPLDAPRTRPEWENLAKNTNAIGYHARRNLARLDRGEKLETEIPYTVQVWNFGGDLAMVFLEGEDVVDYSLRLKREFDSARLWVNGYANGVPGYIPSERVLKEGGYEGEGAMVYYDHPAKFAPGLENRIIGAVHELMPADYLMDEHKAQFPAPKSPQDSLAQMQTDAGLKIELVASEPLIESPVAIDWGADGKLWVVEMRDYPMGMDGQWKPGGRVKYLESTHHDGKYDKATLFLDNLPFPTGVMPWRDGALVCAAPDVLFARASKPGAPADVVKKVLSGFVTNNYQARVNGLSYGLDNQVYGANGLLGGSIHGMAGGAEVDIRGRDFRMNPDTGVFEPASGLTQQGRARDDWGNWFGCDNSNPLWNYPLPDHYVRRNPYVTAPAPNVYAATGPEPNLVHAISRLLERFNEPNSANHITSGCGLGIYRDDFLGPAFYNNALICEPVADVVHRLRLHEDANGAVVTGTRAPGEQDCEFVASRDNWFRPVQSRLGPDGAVYIVDMYRFVIEHPDWISKERLASLDVRAGADRGRIYRIFPDGKKLRPIPNLKKLSTAKLVAALETPNGIERDLVHIELVQRADSGAVRPLAALASHSSMPAVRVQALCVLDGLKALSPQLLETALNDPDVHVQRQAIRLSEPWLAASQLLQSAVLKRVDDPAVRYQLALSLGEWNDPRAGRALGQIAVAGAGDKWIRAAVLSSAVPQTAEILGAVMAADHAPGRKETVEQLVTTAVAEGDPQTLSHTLEAIAPAEGAPISDWHIGALKSLMDALKRKKLTLNAITSAGDAGVRDAAARLQPVYAAARRIAVDPASNDSARLSAIALLGSDSDHHEEDMRLLGGLLSQTNSLPAQKAALENFKHSASAETPAILLENWKEFSPALRTTVLEILLSRENSTRALLDALRKHLVEAGELSAANRQRLLKNPSPEIARESLDLLKTGALGARAEVMARYAITANLLGDPRKGEAHFIQNCTPCHSFKGHGYAVGPDLAPLADKTPSDFILAILDPSAAIEPRFVAYNIETKDDRSLTGIVKDGTATSLTLVQPGGVKETILRSDIVSMKASRLSLMPEGFEQAMRPQDLADLIAYLKQPNPKTSVQK